MAKRKTAKKRTTKAKKPKSGRKKDGVTLVVDGEVFQVARGELGGDIKKYIKGVAKSHGISKFKAKVNGKKVGVKSKLPTLKEVQKIEVYTHDTAA